MNSREKLADVLIVYSISRLSHLFYLISKYINICINTFPAYNATSHISTHLVPMTSKRHEWQQQCFILCSTLQFTRLSLLLYFVCFHMPNSCESWTPENTCSSLGPQRTVSYFCVSPGVTQSILSFPLCAPCELLFMLKNPFQIGHIVCLSGKLIWSWRSVLPLPD